MSTWSPPLDVGRVKILLEREGQTFLQARHEGLEVPSPFCHRCPVCLWHRGLTVSSLLRKTTHHISYSYKDDVKVRDWEQSVKIRGWQIHWSQGPCTFISQVMQKLKKVWRKRKWGFCPLKKTNPGVLKATNSVFLGMNLSLNIKNIINTKYENTIYAMLSICKSFCFFKGLSCCSQVEARQSNCIRVSQDLSKLWK